MNQRGPFAAEPCPEWVRQALAPDAHAPDHLACVVDAAMRIRGVNGAWSAAARTAANPDAVALGQVYRVPPLALATEGMAAAQVISALHRVLSSQTLYERVTTTFSGADCQVVCHMLLLRIDHVDGAGALLAHQLSDITSKGQTPERDQRRLLHNLLTNFPGCVYRCRNDPTWPMISVSEGIEELCGLTPEAFMTATGGDWAQLIHPEDRDLVWQTVQAALAARRPFELTYRVRHTSGDLKWVWERGWGVFQQSGEMLRLEGMITDVTERTALELELRDARKLEAVGRLAGGVAHDFNNLLTVILGSAALLEASPQLRRDDRSELSLITQAARQAAALTGQLLTFARQRPVTPKLVELNGLIERYLQMLRRVVGDTVDVRFIPATEPCVVCVEPAQMEQLLMNLAMNAKEAMPSGGHLFISTTNISNPEANNRVAAGDYVAMVVEDTGVGMSEETLEQVFEPFFTTRPGHGTGLGLASCYGIVKQAEGHIHVESTLGRGSSFEVLLPAAQGAQAPHADPVPAAIRRAASNETLLLVEDNPLVLQVTSLALRAHGRKVLETGSGEQALEKIRSYAGRIHLIVTDVRMPGMSGRDFAEHAERLRPGVPILFVSGDADHGPSDVWFRPRHHGFLHKPFTPQELNEEVERLLAAE